MGSSCTCDMGTIANDPRIEEMQDLIINKDAKLNSMKNTIAVMENDLREPYCIYANIYTALEKIFATLCQNDKYRQYLKLMISGKDIRCVGIKSKILVKLKILENFCCALIVPCNREFTVNSNYDSVCYRSEVSETNFALTSVEATSNNNDNKRAYLVADIIENDEMKEILSKDSFSTKNDADVFDDGYTVPERIAAENLQRLKKLQENFDDLMMCYESLKHDQQFLEVRCKKYAELEKEFEHLKSQIQEYDSLWNEKEHYRNRSTAMDNLKEQFLMLSDETVNLETQLKAETEINHIKCKTIEDLRRENFILEQKLNEALLEYEKDKNSLMCKLKEADCRTICQNQQIKSLSVQIDRLLEQDQQSINTREDSIALLDELETQKDHIKNLKETLFYNEEEKQNLHRQYHDQLELINNLKIEIEDWKGAYEKTLQHKDYLEKYTESLVEQNKLLSQDLEEKNVAVDNLIKLNGHKSQEIDKLISDVEKRKMENQNLVQQVSELRSSFDINIEALETEKIQAVKSLQLANDECHELLDKVKDNDQIVRLQTIVGKSSVIHVDSKRELPTQGFNEKDENINTDVKLPSRKTSNSTLLQEIQQLHQVSKLALNNINNLQDENKLYKTSVEVTQKESNELKLKLNHFENVAVDLQNLRESHEKLLAEKEKLENELLQKNYELEDAIRSIQLNKRESDELLDKLHQSENHRDELIKIREKHRKLNEEKYTLKKDLLEKTNELEKLLQTINDIKSDNERLVHKCKEIDILKSEVQNLQKTCDALLNEKDTLQNKLSNKIQEFENLNDNLDKKIKENENLNEQIKSLEIKQIKVESTFNTLETELDQLKKSHNLVTTEKEKLQNELEIQSADLKRVENENVQLIRQSQNIIAQNNDLEKALISTRSELINSTPQGHSADNIVKEIEKMRQEKITNQKKIWELRDKQDEYEYIISNLREVVMARDDRIAMLQNHINKLQDEVRHFNKNLSIAIDTGEQIRDFSSEIEDMEAHHSKATHNMKIELAKLQQQDAILEEKLSINIIKSDESFQNNEILMNKIRNLENEREIIFTDIKQLEIKAVGDSSLGPVRCGTKDVLDSIERISDSFDKRKSALENTILKVQTSSQLLLSKAEEATKLVEKEKQKIINEKEEAIKSKINMENQLLEFKNKLERQRLNDSVIIKDLRATISNQELLLLKINNDTKEQIEQLKLELGNLENIYKTSLKENDQLQKKITDLSDDRNLQIELLNKVKVELVHKSKEIVILQKELEHIKNKIIANIGIQTDLFFNSDTSETQTDKELWRHSKIKIGFDRSCDDKSKAIHELEQKLNFQYITNTKSEQKPEIHRYGQEKEQTYSNEVQILTANVEPVFDCKKSDSNINSPNTRRFEKHSESITNENERINHQKTYTESENNPKLIDIFEYNKQSMHTDSPRVDEFIENSIACRERQEAGTIEFGNSDINVNSSNGKNKINHKVNPYSNDRKEQKALEYSETVQDTLAAYPKQEENLTVYSKSLCEASNISKNNETDNLRLKLKIKIPRINNESSSWLTSSDGEKSRCSNTAAYSTTSKQHLSTSETNILNDENNRQTKSITPSLTAIYNGESFLVQEDVKKRRSHQNVYEIMTKNSNCNNSNKSKLSNKRLETPNLETNSQIKLFRDKANAQLLGKDENFTSNGKARDFGLDYILNTVHGEINPIQIRRMQSQEKQIIKDDKILKTTNVGIADSNTLKLKDSKSSIKNNNTYTERGIMAKLDSSLDYENRISYLTKTLENIEKDHKKKIDAIKVQYSNNIMSIINDHNQGVKSIQNLHEDTLEDIIRTHENEVENWRSMSIEAMRKADMLEKENLALKNKVQDRENMCHDEEPIKMQTQEIKRKKRHRGDSKSLTKTIVEAFNVKPKPRTQGPCTCSLDINLSDTIRNIFEQVDVEQRKMAENTYMKYVANKIMTGDIENLDAQELSFLHLKVCRMWKSKLYKEEALQKRRDSFETELINKQRSAQQHIAELDRKVSEERRRLQEVREAVCRSSVQDPQAYNTDETLPRPLFTTCTTHCACKSRVSNVGASVVGSSGDLTPANLGTIRPRQTNSRNDKNRTTYARLGTEEGQERRMYSNEPPTRLRRSHDRQLRVKK